VALLWKMIYNSGDPTSLRHPVPKIRWCQYGKYSKLTNVDAIFERAVNGAEILVFMVHILRRVQEIARPGVCLGRPS